jgi:hypothetical protein
VPEATSGFDPEGASVVATQPGATTFAFGYAGGHSGSGGSGGGGGSAGDTGGGSSGAGGGSAGAGGAVGGHVDASNPASVSGPTGGEVPTDTDNAGQLNTGHEVAFVAPSTGGDEPTGGQPEDSTPPTVTRPTEDDTSPPPTNAAKDQDGANTPHDTGANSPHDTGASAPKGDAAPVVSLDPTSPTTGTPLPGFQPAATPELDSLTLMATGLGGFGVYALARWRTRSRKRDKRG